MEQVEVLCCQRAGQRLPGVDDVNELPTVLPLDNRRVLAGAERREVARDAAPRPAVGELHHDLLVAVDVVRPSAREQERREQVGRRAIGPRWSPEAAGPSDPAPQ